MKKVLVGIVSLALAISVACSGGAEKGGEVKQEKAKPANVAKPPAKPAKKEAPKPPTKTTAPAKQEGKVIPAKMEGKPMEMPKGGMKQAPNAPQKIEPGKQAPAMKQAAPGPQKMMPGVKPTPAKNLKVQGGPQKMAPPIKK